MPENKMVNLDELKQWVVIGVDADGEPVIGQSPKVTVQDMASMLARVQVNLQIQAAEIGYANAVKNLQRMANTNPSRIVRPGSAQ